MQNKKNIIKILLLLATTFLLLQNPGILQSQFLMDKDEPIIEDLTEKKEPAKKKTPPKFMAYNIKASTIPGIPNAIMITWDVDSSYTDEFIVGRSNVVIDTSQRALAAKTVRTVSARQRGVLIDSNLSAGTYYYVILESPRIEKKEIYLSPDVNYTVKSITIKEVKGPVEVKKLKNLNAKLIGDTVILLSWDKIGGKGHTYTVYRSTTILDSIERLSKGEKIAKLSDAGQYIDQNITRGGTYFYAVTFQYLNGPEDRRLEARENYITEGIYVKPLPVKIKSDPHRVIMIRAQKSGNNVVVTWDYSGKTGNKYIRLYRTRRLLKDIKAVNEENVLADVEIKAGKFLDKNPPGGTFYYGLAPYKESAGGSFAIRQGVNITRRPISIKGSSVEKIEDNEPVKKEKIIDLERDYSLPIIVKPDDENDYQDKEEKETGTVDEIIRRTFFKDRFRRAIKELQSVMERTDNIKDRARARLFIGRSYVELGRYRKAVTILSMKDVAAHYPKEAAFWREFALLRLKE